MLESWEARSDEWFLTFKPASLLAFQPSGPFCNLVTNNFFELQLMEKRQWQSSN